VGVIVVVLWASMPLLWAQAPSAYEQAVLAKKPIAYWRLDEVKGPTVIDRTGNGHNGTVHGTPMFRVPGALEGDADTAIKITNVWTSWRTASAEFACSSWMTDSIGSNLTRSLYFMATPLSYLHSRPP
jgi:hypothetical protein